MCGILALIGSREPDQVEKLAQRMSHRGPDESDRHVFASGDVLCHQRLSIMDLHTGKQPIKGSKNAYVIHNGEIYNHISLKNTLLKDCTFTTTCDSEVLVHLFENYGTNFCHLLDGVFAFVVADGEHWMAARDPIGVKPLYYGKDKAGNLYFSSELKAINDQVVDLKAFPPGHYMSSTEGLVKYYKPQWEQAKVANVPIDLLKLRNRLTAAVEKRLMSDVPLGVLLSGGLDSSLIASIVARLMKKQNKALHSFSIGISPDAPDLVAARKVADFIGSIHHEVIFTIDEGIEALPRVIHHLETYDVTTVRAATPMYFLSKAIKEQGIKVVLSGEGADEIFGGYLYFHGAPSALEFQKETIKRVLALSTADCLRADKSTMAHGIEARVPFLDLDFLDTVMPFEPKGKQPDLATGKAEKWILRAAFDVAEAPYLPHEILWRQKEQFGDGVGYNWIDAVKEYAEQKVSCGAMALAEVDFPYNTPDTKEALYFRQLFNALFPQEYVAQTVIKWIPKWQKDTDPSGRANNNHTPPKKRKIRA